MHNQNFIKLSAAVHELSRERRKKPKNETQCENNTVVTTVNSNLALYH